MRIKLTIAMMFAAATFALSGCDDAAEEPPPEEGAEAAEGAEGEGEAEGEAAAEENPNAVGKVDAIEGSSTLKRGEESKELAVGMDIENGDTIETGDAAKVRLKMKGEMTLAIGAKTKMVIGGIEVGDGRKGNIEVLSGKFWAQLNKWTGSGESAVEFKTPSAVAGIRGTTLWGDIDVDAICSLEGTIEVRSTVEGKTKGKKKKKKKKKKGKAKDDVGPKTLNAGECAAKLSKGKTASLKPTAEQVEGYLAEVLIKG